jgi:hypothetical protein
LERAVQLKGRSTKRAFKKKTFKKKAFKKKAKKWGLETVARGPTYRASLSGSQ